MVCGRPIFAPFAFAFRIPDRTRSRIIRNSNSANTPDIKLTNEDDIKNIQKMLNMFEDNDDVQNVWHNWEDAE